MSTKPEFTKEIRLGLVVYGGVALAVYMNGVCREFYNVVQGKGIYKLLKALTGSDIVVDIISGTSAGGINGVLLSFALTNGIDFKHFADIWREKGDITKLLRNPQLTNQNFESVLDGEGYYQQALESAFRDGWYKGEEDKQQQKGRQSDQWQSEFRELDLFVTGTDVLGKVYSVIDNTGSLIEVKDHRCVFLLKHRKDRKEPFDPCPQSDQENSDQSSRLDKKVITALAKLCRITSCFPVAFPVVSVKLKSDDPVDNKLVEWGELDKRYLGVKPDNGYQLHFIDGGVLDNRPFSYTIKEIYNRTAFKPVDRKIFYIDPNPEDFEEGEDFLKMKRPNILKVVSEALIGLPSYQSIGNDLQAVCDLNKRVRRYNLMLDNINIMSLMDVTDNPEDQEYRFVRVIAMRDRVLPLVMQLDSNKIENIKDQEKIHKFRNAILALTHLLTNKDIQVISEFNDRIRNKDISYMLRKLFFIAKQIGRTFDNSELSTDKYRALENLGNKVTRYIRVLQVIEFGLNGLLKSDQVHNGFMALIPINTTKENLLEVGSRLFNYLTDIVSIFLESEAIHQHFSILISDFEGDNLPSANITAFGNCLQPDQKSIEHIKKLIDQQTFAKLQEYRNSVTCQSIFESRKSLDGSILQKIESRIEALIDHDQHILGEFHIPQKFKNYRHIDRVIYPKRFLSGLPDEEEIDLIRISTYDAKMGLSANKDPKSKLSGDILYAFGGFFKKSWRSNDILWGRLDGLNRLVQGLITQESIGAFKSFVNSGNSIDELIDESLSEENPLKSEIRQIMVNILHLLESDQEIPDSIIADLHKSLVTAGHYEILLEDDLMKVIADSVEEQLGWMQTKIAKDNSAVPNFQPSNMSFNSLITALIAKKITDDAIKNNLSTLESRIWFFKEKYTVGEEDLQSIPKNVLDKIIGQMIAVVLKLATDRFSQGKFSWLIRFFLYIFIQILSCFAIKIVRRILKY